MIWHGRLRWFRHLERKSVDDWVPACRNVEVAGVKRRGRKTRRECVNDDVNCLVSGLQPEWAIFRNVIRDLIWGKLLTLLNMEEMEIVKIPNDDYEDDGFCLMVLSTT